MMIIFLVGAKRLIAKPGMPWNWISLFQIWHNIAHTKFDELPKAELLSIEALRFIDFMRGMILS
ncbi:MAG: hypothetical protein QW723_02320 [Candidatus Bathyarchaeia archaeon]